MKKLISFKRAAHIATGIFSVLSLFHLGIIVGILFLDFAPVEFLWGGQFDTAEELLQFEILSFLIMVFCVLIVLVRRQTIAIPALLRTSRIALWLLTALFLLNTVGNLLAKTNFEKGFALVTVILAGLCLRMALEPAKKG